MAGLLIFLLYIVTPIVVLLAIFRLFSIDRSLKQILAELQSRRAAESAIKLGSSAQSKTDIVDRP